MTKRKQRLKNIIDIVNQKGKVTVKQLSSRLNVSEMTVRRDLNDLENKKIIKRIHGGAVLYSSFIDGNNIYVIKEQTEKNVKQKSLIGLKAASLINPNETIFLDAGTTTLFIAKYLDRDIPLTVLTCTFENASEFHYRKNTNLILTGGYYHRDSSVFHSKEGYNLIKSIRADKAYISTAGIDENLGLTTYYYFEVDIKKTMIQSAKKIILVTDSSKFGKISVAYFASLKEIDTIITDNGISDNYKKIIKNLGIELIIAK